VNPEPKKETVIPEPKKETVNPEPKKETVNPEPKKETVTPEPIKTSPIADPPKAIVTKNSIPKQDEKMAENDSPLYYNADLTDGTPEVPVRISKDFGPKTFPIGSDSPQGSKFSTLKKKAKELPQHDTADCLFESKITNFVTTPKPQNLTCITDKPITETDLD
jgi:hypothetical protein